MVALVRERRGRGWAPGQRDALAASEGRSPGSGSCGPARRPGPRRLGGGSAPVPRRARVLEPGQHQAGRPFGDSRARSPLLGWVCGPGVVAGRRRAGPGSGFARAHADRGWAWRLVGGREAPGGQVAADRRDRHPAGPSCLSDRQARLCPQVMLRVGKLTERLLLGVVTTVPAIRSRLCVGHDRSLSPSVGSVLTDLSMGRAVADGGDRFRSWVGRDGCSEARASRRVPAADGR
jgi:hypothetical protein